MLHKSLEMFEHFKKHSVCKIDCIAFVQFDFIPGIILQRERNKMMIKYDTLENIHNINFKKYIFNWHCLPGVYSYTKC